MVEPSGKSKPNSLSNFTSASEPAANADVVAHGHRQGVHHVALSDIVVLEELSQHIEKRSPKAGLYGVQSSVEATLGDRLLDVAVLVQKRAARLYVAGKEGTGHERYGHHLGGGQTGLGVVAMAYCLQELVAQVVGSGYGIVHCVLPIQREGFRRPSDREDIDYRVRGQLGLPTWRRRTHPE